MKNYLKTIFLAVAAMVSLQLYASTPPIYIVDGKHVSSINQIPQEQIESIEMLEPTEQIIAQYGVEASNGVAIIILKYTSRAQFSQEQTFQEYIEQHVKWGGSPQRVIVRFEIGTEGRLEVLEVMESTSNLFKRRVVKALEKSPQWTPAMRGDEPITEQMTVVVELPMGEKVASERYIILR